METKAIVEKITSTFQITCRSGNLMSAFVISHQAMDRCVGAILYKEKPYGSPLGTFCGQAVESWDPSQLGRMLYGLNTQAVAQRYNEAPADMSSYCFNPNNVGSLEAGIKALESLLYQCSEGDIFETSGYKELERALGLLCLSVVRSSPAYEKAPW